MNNVHRWGCCQQNGLLPQKAAKQPKIGKGKEKQNQVHQVENKMEFGFY